jgi:aldose 1-epimerase
VSTLTENSGLFCLESPDVQVSISPLGGTLVSVRSRDRRGQLGEICLGLPSTEAYLEDQAFLGALVGRVANRIGGASFVLDGTRHELEANEGLHHLHGGSEGLHRVRWKAEVLPEGGGLRLTHRSPDGAGGYPGTLDIEACYRLSGSRLSLSLHARTDRPTPVNLTHHPYWSLSGSGTVHDHVLQVFSQAVTPTDEHMIPTGAIAPVEATPLDMQKPTLLGPVIDATGGLDHNYVLAQEPGPSRLAARLLHPPSGRCLTISTTLPGLQVYTGGGLQGELGHGGRPHLPFSGICLEPQFFPDAVHHEVFASPVLRPGQTWFHEIHIDLDVVEDR